MFYKIRFIHNLLIFKEFSDYIPCSYYRKKGQGIFCTVIFTHLSLQIRGFLCSTKFLSRTV